MVRQQKREHVDGEIKDAIADAVRQTKSTATAIHKAMVKRFPEKRIPSLRTVQRLVREFTIDDPTDPWLLADADDPADAALVLSVIATPTLGCASAATARLSPRPRTRRAAILRSEC